MWKIDEFYYINDIWNHMQAGRKGYIEMIPFVYKMSIFFIKCPI